MNLICKIFGHKFTMFVSFNACGFLDVIEQDVTKLKEPWCPRCKKFWSEIYSVYHNAKTVS